MNRRIEGERPNPDDQVEAAHEAHLPEVLDLEPDDPELAAWLLSRERDLEEMAWAQAEPCGEEGRP